MKKYSKLIVAAIVALIFIGTFVFLYEKSHPMPIDYTEITLNIGYLLNTTDGILTAHFQVDFWTAISSAILICILGGLAGLAPASPAMSIKPVDAMSDA